MSSRKVVGSNLQKLFVDGLFVIFLVALLASSGRAQAEAWLRGFVSDPSGAGIAGAAVKITNLETGAERSLMTDDAGRFSAPSLVVGRYEIAASKPGFQTDRRTAITLVVGQREELNLTLHIGAVHQRVEVAAYSGIVAVTTEDISGLVGERQVKDLPLNGRSYDQLLTLNPGIVNYTSQRSGSIGTSNSVLGNMFAVSGRRPQENLFLLNDVEFTGASEINNTPGGTSGQLLGVDAVREFAVVKDTYGAEFGKRPGAQVSIVTSGGSSEIHGSAYLFLRNSALDARNYFDQGAIPQFQRNVFGGSLGGPIVKGKTFLFGNYEGYRQHLGLGGVTLVPDNNARAGLLPCSAVTPAPNPCPASGLVNVGVAASAAPLLKLWPVANGPDLGQGIAEAFSHPLQIVNEDFGTARIDHIFRDRDSLAAVYTVDDSAANTPAANPLSSALVSLREQVVSLSETHLLSSAVVNQGTFGFSRGAFYFTADTSVSLPGFVQGRPIGAVVVGGGTTLNGASQISTAGTNAGSNLSAVRNLFTGQDRVTATRGIHTAEFGVWVQRLQANDALAQNQYGQASFSDLQGFLDGTVSTFTVAPVATPLGWRSLEGAVFAQDALKLAPNFELRIGFRGEFTNGWNESRGRASNYVFDSNGVIVTNPVVGNSALTVNNAKFLSAPRFGIAWSPFSSKTTVIRAGFGLYYALNDNLSYRLDQNGPFNTVFALKNVALSTIDIVPGAPIPAGAKISPSGVQPDLKTPTVESYSLKIEQQITPNTSLAIGYVGSHGYHELLSIDANVPVPAICPASPCPGNLAAGTLYNPTNAPLANPQVANTTSWFSEGISSYHGLEVDVSHRLSHGLQFRGVYTFSKSLDDGDNMNTSIATNSPAFTMNPLQPKWDYGRASFDIRQVAIINAIYDLPFGRNKASGTDPLLNRLSGGWQISGIATLQTGLPFTPQMSFNPANDGDSRNPIRPSWNPAFTGQLVLGGANRYFDANAFVVPPKGTYGHAGRNILQGSGLAELDLALAKKLSLSEHFGAQFRIDFFNVLNHTNFNTPNTIVFTSATGGPSPTAGVITATSTSSRQIQLGLKLLW
ncbi:MAG: TonB-dependent receptor [Acidobacteria bacterium]|nr:MAG: TonB-dependent receptor [Acidobacteriota bacterium]